MKLAIFLHAYQPPTQYPSVTKQFVEESYSPLLKVLENSPGSITLNVTGALTEQLLQYDFNYQIEQISRLSQSGKVDLVGTAAFHPLLAYLPHEEIQRQTKINDAINREAFGDTYNPTGFFIPEMVYEQRLDTELDQLPYKWTILGESAYPGAGIHNQGEEHQRLKINDQLYTVDDTDTIVFFRDRPMSLAIAFNKDLTLNVFTDELMAHINEVGEEYVVLAVDAETFSYHGNLELLEQILHSEKIETVTVSSLLDMGLEYERITPNRSTWGSTREDYGNNRIFVRWNDPENELHKWQWELFNLAMKVGVHSSKQVDDFDRALHSDQFWWASRSPCWHPGMVERGTNLLMKTIQQSQHSTEGDLVRSQELFKKIVVDSQKRFGSAIVNC